MGGRFRSALALGVAAVATGAAAAAPTSHEVSSVASPSDCAVRRGPLSYRWPVRPFDVAHPVRGNFGDPRTVFEPEGRGRFSFHNGVDIAAADGTLVYPVRSGVVEEVRADELVVQADDGRRFQYYHLFPLVQPGDRVEQGATVLGDVKPGAHHVHLSEIHDGIVQNPLAPGHLTPYSDSTPPVVSGISFAGPGGTTLSADRLTGKVTVLAAAYDLPSLPVPGTWNGFPVAPAALSWSLATPGGREVVPPRVTVDFREGEPRDSQFWHVYARGTIQNFPAVGRHFLYRHAGTYVFDLTPEPLDTRTLPPGRYALTVTALDVCGNSGSRSVSVAVLQQRPSISAPPTRGLLRWPPRLDGYTDVLASLPAADGAAAARSAAFQAEASGVRRVGILLSSRYAGLEPDDYLIFSGVYRTPWAAERALGRAGSLFPAAYPREIRADLIPAAASTPGSRGRPAAPALRRRGRRPGAGASPAAATPRQHVSTGRRAR